MLKKLLIAGALWSLAAFATPSLADRWVRHDGRWYFFNVNDARWYHNDGEHWYYHQRGRWHYYPFDARFGSDWQFDRDVLDALEIEEDRLPRYVPPPIPRVETDNN